MKNFFNFIFLNEKKIIILVAIIWLISLVLFISNKNPQSISFYILITISVVLFYIGVFIVLKKIYKKLFKFVADELKLKLKDRKSYRVGKIAKKGFLKGLEKTKEIYVLSLIMIVLFPPFIRVRTNIEVFEGWKFISNLGGIKQIKISYLLIELALVTVVFLLFRKKENK
jgi:hypothetical protein